MSTITAKDGTEIYYKDWGQGPVVTFSHGWPLNADAWDGQLLFLAQNGFRAVAHDRRGHGRSSQASSGNDMNGYADDLAAVIEALDLRDATLVGHSTGGGEVSRYIGRHGTGRVAKAVLIAAVPPLMLQTAANPDGLPMEVFDGLRSGLAKDRSQFYKDLATQFYGANRPSAEVSQGVLDQFWLWSMQAGLKNAYESIKAFSSTSSSRFGRRYSTRRSTTVRPWRCSTDSTVATALATAAGSVTAASSHSHTQSGWRRAWTAACSARLLLPTPPGPINVTTRAMVSVSDTCSSVSSRPTRSGRVGGKFPGGDLGVVARGPATAGAGIGGGPSSAGSCRSTSDSSRCSAADGSRPSSPSSRFR